jgi:hypothetical protein
MSRSTFSNRAASPVGPATILKPVTPSDTADLPDGVSRSLYVGVAGALAVVDAAGNEATLFSGAGQYHPIRVARVLAAGTTATSILALY